MNADTYIPRRLDDSWKIGFWDADVAAPFLFCFFIGYTAGTKLAFVIAMAVGIYLSRWLARIKSDKHPAFALHWVYWNLPPNPLIAMKSTPPSHLRRMVG
jgi:conjugal transfer pilus assembly protein TraL